MSAEDRETILVYLVDDDQDQLRLIGEKLAEEDASFRFREFTSPQEALAALAGQTPDVIVSDHRFVDEFTGLDFLRRLREERRVIPFIFLTGQGSEEVAAEGFRVGAEDYFTKDVGFAHFTRIAAAIRRASRHHRDRLERDHLGSRYRDEGLLRRLLMDEAKDSICVIDERGIVLDVNRTALQRSGYSAEDLIGRRALDFIRGDERGALAAALGTVGSNAWPDRIRTVLVSKDGREMTIEASVSPLDPSAERRLYLVIARSVSDWEERVRSLRWNRDLLEKVVDSLEEVVHVVDRDLTILFCNRSMDTLSRGNLRGSELAGRKLTAVFPFLEAKGVTAEYRKVFDEGVPLLSWEKTEYAGQQIVTKTSKIPVHGEDGAVMAVVTIMRDITPESLVQEEKARLLKAVDEATVGVALTDCEGKIVYANARVAQIHGYASPRELLGWRGRDFSASAEHSEEIEACIAAKGQWQGEILVHRADGSTVPVLLSLCMLRDERGTPLGLAVFVQDITKEKAMDEAMAAKNRELEALNLELNSFISMTSHELKNPLTNIEGFARLLEERLDTLPPAEVKDFAHRITSNAGRLHLLIDDLLTFGRERKRASRYEDVELRGLLDEVLGNLGREIEKEGAQVTLDLAVTTARSDRQKLFQTLKNLVENAVVYHRDGVPPLVTVAARGAESGGLLFTVTDNGRGVVPKEQGVIFEIFRRGSSSRGRYGTGVGLALVRENVRKMGGRVWVESEPGAGSTFSFTLPQPRE